MCLYLWLRSKEQKSQNDDCKKQNTLSRAPLVPQGWNTAFLTEVGTTPRPQPFLQFWGYLIEDYYVFPLTLKKKLVGQLSSLSREVSLCRRQWLMHKLTTGHQVQTAGTVQCSATMVYLCITPLSSRLREHSGGEDPSETFFSGMINPLY